MKKKFLTVSDYGMGGVWTYIFANSAKDVSDKYPKLKVLDQEPDWFDASMRMCIKAVDINDLPDSFLAKVRKPLPTVHMELRIEADETGELKRLITEFGNSRGFAIEEQRMQARTVHGHSYEISTMFLARFDIDICVSNDRGPDQIKIEICNAGQSPEFDAIVAKFRKLLESRWPGLAVASNAQS